MTDPIDPPAVKTLRAFFAEMYEWEREYLIYYRSIHWETAKEDDIENYKQSAQKRAVLIFERYCEIGSNAKRVTEALRFGGLEPDYNPEKEIVESVSVKGNKAVIETRQTHSFRFKLRYELIKVGDNWMIRDNKKHWDESQRKWRTDSL